MQLHSESVCLKSSASTALTTPPVPAKSYYKQDFSDLAAEISSAIIARLDGDIQTRAKRATIFPIAVDASPNGKVVTLHVYRALGASLSPSGDTNQKQLLQRVCVVTAVGGAIPVEAGATNYNHCKSLTIASDGVIEADGGAITAFPSGTGAVASPAGLTISDCANANALVVIPATASSGGAGAADAMFRLWT